MQVIFSRSFAALLESTGVTSNSLEPGVVNTGLSQGITDDPEMRQRLENGVPVEEGVKTHLFLAASSKAAGETGGNWEDCVDISKGLGKAKYLVAAPSLSRKMHDDLWKATEDFIHRVEHPDQATAGNETLGNETLVEPEPEAGASATA